MMWLRKTHHELSEPELGADPENASSSLDGRWIHSQCDQYNCGCPGEL
jgi:hypothetical protein